MASRCTHVLLAEDDRDTREMYTEYLTYSGLCVTTAANGRGALERARLERPDVVVTDIAMPEMDGIELSRRLRADDTTHDVPIIAVSGQCCEPARLGDADVVLTKPCEPDRLLKVIESVTRHQN